MLDIDQLHFSYGTNHVLRGISARVQPGSVCAFFGPNGCGKTTLFRCCLRLQKPDQGEIFVNGRKVQKMSVGELARQTAFVPQEHQPPFPYLVKEVVLMGRTPHLGGGVFSIAPIHFEKTLAALELLGIKHLADRHYHQLSGGQRQMVLIARAIAQDTPLIFLDEPTSALDYHNQIKIWQILRQLAGLGKTIVACSHDPNHVVWFCDQVVMMDGGKVIDAGDPAACFKSGNLEKIYGDTCVVREWQDSLMVLPRVVVDRQELIHRQI
jgi:iron complex transport system ATP-binding protein